ncbi:MAG: biotin--[acetyl-CoA-carboxylase] ligase [Gammaproteobacteria bacterium]|nr:biotin--[acetyl-CoA-carboxylase] ligase [Gammaproteobacteria bacterium]
MLDAEAILADVNGTTRSHVTSLEVFDEIASTNSYLMDKRGPAPGELYIAVTTNQTAGRGRQGRRWLSPPGSGLCLSIAYTVASRTDNLSALTLAVGIGAITSLQDVNAQGIRIKWPNDLVAENRKLGGILTEAKTHAEGSVTVVIGVGLNLDLGEGFDLGNEAKRAMPVTDLNRIVATMPAPDTLAARLINRLHAAIMNFEAAGFAYFAREWAKHDWLLGRELTVDTSSEQLRGTGAGVARDGALLVDVGSADPRRITAGTIVTTSSSSAGAHG